MAIEPTINIIVIYKSSKSINHRKRSNDLTVKEKDINNNKSGKTRIELIANKR